MKTRTVIITGGTKGIGQDIARAFHKEGCNVFVAARSDNGFASEFAERMSFRLCDVQSVKAIHDLVDGVVEETGRIDVLVNNVGFSEWRPLDAVDEAFWGRMMDTNLKSAFFATQAVVPVMEAQHGGVVINISSLASKRGTSNNSVYCATKFAMNGVTQALAKELGPKNIRVNGICPVLVSTPGLLEALEHPYAPTGGKDVQGWLDSFAASQAALKRLPTGDDVAAMCIFLASPSASAISGQSINVDCGVLPQ